VVGFDFATVSTSIFAENRQSTQNSHAIKAKVSTKEISKEFSNTFLDYTIKCIRHIKLSVMRPVEDQLLSFSYINAHFIMLSPVTDMSKLFSEVAFGVLRNQ